MLTLATFPLASNNVAFDFRELRNCANFDLQSREKQEKLVFIKQLLRLNSEQPF